MLPVVSADNFRMSFIATDRNVMAGWVAVAAAAPAPASACFIVLLAVTLMPA